jgi:protein-tyrosine phosphatase
MFRKAINAYPDLSVIGTDLHSHLLPGLDDGAATLEDSLEMIAMMRNLGYRKLITTPHVVAAYYPNTRERIEGQMYALREEVELVEEVEMVERVGAPGGRPPESQPPVGIVIEVSGEYHLDKGFLGLLERGEVIPFGAERYILIEFPWRVYPVRLGEILSEIDRSGFTPILAHPERVPYLAMKFKSYEALKEMGLLFQMNLCSLTGLYGWPIRMVAEKLIGAGMVEVVGSDAHHQAQVRELAKVTQNKHFDKLVQSGRLINHTL